jgi:hypothetical protein
MHCQVCLSFSPFESRSFLAYSNKPRGCQSTSSVMLSLFSLSTRVFHANIWTRPVQSLWSCSRTESSISQDTKSTGQDTKLDQVSPLPRSTKDDPNLRHEWRYQNEDEYRKRIKDARTNYRRSPLGREKTKAAHRKHDSTSERKEYKSEFNNQTRQESLPYRRSRALDNALRTGRWIKEAWTWKLHTPLMALDRVDHHAPAVKKIASSSSGGLQRPNQPLTCATSALPTTLISWCQKVNVNRCLQFSPLLIYHFLRLRSPHHDSITRALI